MDQAGSWDEGAARAIIAAHRDMPGATLPILHALQDHFGYVDRAAIPLIADALNLSRAEVHGVVTFYHDFRDRPPGRVVVKLCRAEACQALGVEDLVDHLARHHDLVPGRTSADGAVTVESVYCLGNCALGPAALVDGAPVGRLDRAGLDAILGGGAP